MANLGGKITLDISEFQQKITEANRLIRANESAWQASAAQMDDWTKNEEALRSRVSTFSEQIKLQGSIIETLTEKRAALIAKYGAESKEVDRVNAEIIKYSKAMEKMRREQASAQSVLDKFLAAQEKQKKEIKDNAVVIYDAEKATENLSDAYDDNTDEAKKNARASAKVSDAIDVLSEHFEDNEEQVKDTTKATALSESQMKSLTNAISKCGSGFTVLKGVVANLISTALSQLVRTVSNTVNMINTLPDSTRTLRRELTQLTTAFNDVGYSASVAEQAYIEYNAVLGSVDSNASSTISLLAAISASESDVATWTTTLAGVYAKLGTAIPTNELTKNIQQTSNTAKLTENLTKVLQNAGVDVDDVTKKLESLNTSQERSEYILTLLNTEYGELGAQYIKNNESIIEAEKAQLRLNTATSKFGAMMEPLKTSVTNCVADILEALNSLASGEEGAAEELAYNVGYLVGTIAALWSDVYEQLAPYLELLKESIESWFDSNKDALLEKFKAWLTGIFGADAVAAASDLASKIIEPIKTLFNKISQGDYEGALGASLPVITLGMGLSLLKSSVNDIPSTLTSALTTAFTAKSLTMAGAVAGLIGVISLGIELKDAMKTGEYSALAEKVLRSILDGLAVYGVTGSLTAGAFAFALSATLDISTVEFAEAAKKKLGLSDVAMNIVPVLTTSTLSGISVALKSGLKAGFGQAWRVAGISSAVLGIVDIGLEFKDAMTTGDYTEVCGRMLTALMAGFAVGGLTGSFSAGAFTFNMVAALDINFGDIPDLIKKHIPDQVIKVGLVLATGAIASLSASLEAGLAGEFAASWTKVGGIAQGVYGAIALGLKLQAAESVEDYKRVVEDLMVAIIAAGATYGITYSPTASMLVLNVALNLEVGSTAINNVKKAWQTLKSKITGEKTVDQIIEETYSAPVELEIVPYVDYDALGITGLVDPTKVEQQIMLGLSNLDKLMVEALEMPTYKEALTKILRSTSEDGKMMAQYFAEGYGIGLDDLTQITEFEARLIIEKMKEVLGIHSPSTVGTYIGEMFSQGFQDGYAGLPNALKGKTEEAVNGVVSVVESKTAQVESVWIKIWDAIKGGASVVKQLFKNVGASVADIIEGYNADEGATSIYTAIFDKGLSVLKASGAGGTLISAMLGMVRDAMQSDDNALTYLEEAANAIIDAVMQLLDDLPAMAKLALKFMASLGKGFVDALPEILKQLPDIVADIIKEFINMLPEFVQLGVELVKGIGKGIWEGIKSIGNVIYEAGASIVGWFKDVFGIASPSKVMKREIGRNIALGVVEGINENIPAINGALNNVNTRLEFGSQGITKSGMSNKIVNVVQNNTYSRSHSAYELYKSERAIKQLVGAY